ncbi:hypothetical protein GE253_17780 [Niveispirillum sp. SYP-B3756]|uniref:hypothetical protein n=1 Tax=Niveispirillum sp. SYP-B3756 TaxID=2662178 RepID=UPI001290B8F3|nr:hypothetical protein [Niveispirillum sp. SYP-B3756]MQP67179.1 hypothetical protein [Niveispirillum sp. SYP-B3756]
MSLTQHTQPLTAPTDARRPVRVYAVIAALVGADALLMPMLEPALVFADPQFVAIPAIHWLVIALGLSCFALSGTLWWLSSSKFVGLAPLLGFAAGACTLALLGIGWSHLTLWGMSWLMVAAATDIGCGLWMRQALRGQN